MLTYLLHRRSITVWLTSCLTALYSIATDWIQSSQTGGQPYCCTYLYEVREYSLTTHVGQRSEKRCRYKICLQFHIVGRLVNVLQLLKTWPTSRLFFFFFFFFFFFSQNFYLSESSPVLNERNSKLNAKGCIAWPRNCQCGPNWHYNGRKIVKDIQKCVNSSGKNRFFFSQYGERIRAS